ncbi:O-acyltransferase like protein [Amyelois transitella]|uniref:O-acyltransferase like protein n=1 Tax=Amyelois transitella TaxID=680683 RepID=UPI00067D0CB1|nr:O-acyltransferase like protein [Amyelois transitella]
MKLFKMVKMDLAGILLVFLGIGQVKTTTRPLTNIDVLMLSLKSQQWTNDEALCIDTMIATLTHAKNFTMWAVWYVDSMQLPTGQLYGALSHLGNYDECLSSHRVFDHSGHVPSFKYCMNEVSLTNKLKKEIFSRNPNVTTDLYLNKRTTFKKSLSKLFWGLCIPKVCEPHSVAKITRAYMQTSHLSPMDNTTNINVSYCRSGEPEQTSLAFYLFVIFTVSFILMTVSCTYYLSTLKSPPNTFVGALAKSFSLKRNMEELTILRGSEIFSMNIMRILSSVLIISGHMVQMNLFLTVINFMDAEELVRMTSASLLHLDLMTDSFFTISGLLFMKGMFSDKRKSPLKFMWKRYIRLTVAAMFIAGIIALVLPYVGDGPLWNTLPQADIESCKTNWWRSILMIQNILEPRNMCNLVAWQVSCDFQLSIIAAILFWVYQKNKRLGKLLLSLTVVLGMIQSGLINCWHKLSPIPFNGFENFRPLGKPSVESVRESTVFYDVYMQPYTHAPPFLIGAAMGYIMYTYKPNNYRKCFAQLWSYTAVAVALFIMHMGLYGGYFYYFVSTDVTVHSTIYAATHRALWGISICTIIGMSEYGNIPVLQKVFEWFPFVPISRLSYAAYLVQYPLLLLYVGSQRSLVQCDLYQVILNSLGLTVLCYVTSLFIWLFVEGPLHSINSVLTFKTWKNAKEISTTSNGKDD